MDIQVDKVNKQGVCSVLHNSYILYIHLYISSSETNTVPTITATYSGDSKGGWGCSSTPLDLVQYILVIMWN